MDSLIKNCAYCGAQGNLTREHIFPGSIIKRYDEKLISINDKSDKAFRSDLVVKDVCKTCNNGILSKLDKELLLLYDKYMHLPIVPGSCAELKFEYHSLLRVLLKISYNSARSSSDGIKATNTLKKFVPYIIGKMNVDPNVMLRLQIVTSANKYNLVSRKVEGVVEANILRNCKIDYDGHQQSNFILRMVAINSFWFYLIIPTKNVNRANKEALLKGFGAWVLNPGVPLTSSMTSIKIPKEKTTYLHESLLTGMKRKKTQPVNKTDRK